MREATPRKDARPFSCSASMMPRSTRSSERGRVTGPRPWAACVTDAFLPECCALRQCRAFYVRDARISALSETHSQEPRHRRDGPCGGRRPPPGLLGLLAGEDGGADRAAAEPPERLRRHRRRAPVHEREPGPLVVG